MTGVLVAYVSGHGFGHATRTAEVLAAVQALSSRTAIAVFTEAPEALFRAALAGPFTYRRVATDVGLVQKDALNADEEATAERCRAFAAGWPERVAAEVGALREVGARLVLGDIPPLAFAAAHAAGIPSVGLGNFSWDWIYADAARRVPALLEPAQAAAAAYARADLLLRLPFAGDLSAFPRIEDIPLVARRPRVPKAEARRRLGFADGPVVLLSFGGIGLPGFRTDVLASLGLYRFVASQPTSHDPGNVSVVDAGRLAERALGYADLVGACDVVVTKPGYGIVTDAIGARTRLLYTERGDFAEYPILVAGMKRYLPCVHVGNDDLLAGRLAGPLDAALALPFPDPPRIDGATLAARRLLELLD
jgi:L-arabinokinase